MEDIEEVNVQQVEEEIDQVWDYGIGSESVEY